MNTPFKDLPTDEKVRLVEDLWDSIAADQNALSLTKEQQAELDKRLARFEQDQDTGRPADEVIREIRAKI